MSNRRQQDEEAAEDKYDESDSRTANENQGENQGKQEKDDRIDLRGIPHATTRWQAAIEDFTPMWYTISMSSGILGSIMARFPYQFRGLPVLTDIMYMIDLVTFVLITAVMLVRFTMYPRAALRKTASNLEETCFWACAPLAFLTVAALTATQVSNTYWGGQAFSLVAYVMWWIGAVWMMLTAVAIFISLFRLGHVHDGDLTPAIMLPAVGVATAATEGGFIVNYAFDVSARLAMPVIIMSYFLAGFAVFLAVILYSMFMHRLMAHGWPPGAKMPSMCLLMGPFGQSATALQLLGTAAHDKQDFAHYAQGTFLQASAADGLDSASILMSMLLLGFEYFWFMVAVFSILEAAFKGELSYSLVWWGTIFPVATTCTAWLVLAVEMDSPAFRALTVGLYLILLVGYLVNWGFTLYKVFFGNLLFLRSEEDLKKELDQEKLD